MKRLIVNADDFGLTDEINQGIIQAHQEGILTSASLVASGEAFDDAVALARQYPTLDVGVHLTLIEEKSVLSPADIPTLVNAEGYFRKSVVRFVRDYALNRIDVDQVYHELRAQIQKIRLSGIVLSHVDSHQHVHILPRVLPIVVRLAREFQIKSIRAPFEHVDWGNFRTVKRWPRLLQQLGFNISFQHVRHYLKDYAPDHFFGFSDGGHLNTARLARIIAQLPTGVSEVMCHPGLHGGRSLEKYGHWQYNWWDECRSLMHQSILARISKQKVVLTTFRSAF